MLTFGNVTVESSLFLAPMSGISDLPYRMINRAMGCGCAFTEMISASSLAYRGRNTLRMLATAENDRPLGVQLLGSNPEVMKRALDIVGSYDCDLIDINAACPAKKVVSKGNGAGLLRDPVKLQKLLKLIVAYTDLPVTVKIRSGWDETSINAKETALRAQDAGISGLFIHGRTRKQGYSGSVDYRIIRSIKDTLEIPVIASGDALTPLLVKRMLDETGCDGVAIARGALGNPWIFPETAAFLMSGVIPVRPDAYEIAQTMKEHLAANTAFYGERTGVIRFRKFFAWYTRGMAVKRLKDRAFRADNSHAMTKLIDEMQKVSSPSVAAKEITIMHSPD